jgi:DNA-binding PadR family transcriptional regulator
MRGISKGGNPHLHGKHHRGGRPFSEEGELRGGRQRMFEQGHLKLLVLSLLQAQPRHGYELIKAIEELAGGDYTPSPGVIYPTLTLLEETGLVSIIDETGGKKQFCITPEGTQLIEAEAQTIEHIRARLAAAGSVADARRSPVLQRAIQNFKMALHLRLARGELDDAVTRRIAEAIDRAAVEVERS